MSRRFILGSELRPFKPLLETSTDHIAVGKLDIDFASAGPAMTDSYHPSDIGCFMG